MNCETSGIFMIWALKQAKDFAKGSYFVSGQNYQIQFCQLCELITFQGIAVELAVCIVLVCVHAMLSIMCETFNVS